MLVVTAKTGNRQLKKMYNLKIYVIAYFSDECHLAELQKQSALAVQFFYLQC